MRYILKILTLGVLIFGFTSSGSSQKLVDQLPFDHGDIRIEPWSVLKPNTQKGVNIYLPVKDLNTEEAVLDIFYYKGMVSPLDLTKYEHYVIYIDRFI